MVKKVMAKFASYGHRKFTGTALTEKPVWTGGRIKRNGVDDHGYFSYKSAGIDVFLPI
jgi:hypothetical protein